MKHLVILYSKFLNYSTITQSTLLIPKRNRMWILSQQIFNNSDYIVCLKAQNKRRQQNHFDDFDKSKLFAKTLKRLLLKIRDMLDLRKNALHGKLKKKILLLQKIKKNCKNFNKLRATTINVITITKGNKEITNIYSRICFWFFLANNLNLIFRS